MTLKGSHKLIDALLYLKISGSLVVASTGVSECVGGNVCPCLLIRACGSHVGFTVCVCVSLCRNVCQEMLFQSPVSLPVVGGEESQSLNGWGEIRCEQRITCSIWPGSGAGLEEN